MPAVGSGRKIGGHTNLQTTMKHYTGTDAETIRQLTKTMSGSDPTHGYKESIDFVFEDRKPSKECFRDARVDA
jgi:hypothetical protein